MAAGKSGRAEYLRAVQETLEAALCIFDVPSAQVARQNRPEVEVQEMGELWRCKKLVVWSARKNYWIDDKKKKKKKVGGKSEQGDKGDKEKDSQMQEEESQDVVGGVKKEKEKEDWGDEEDDDLDLEAAMNPKDANKKPKKEEWVGEKCLIEVSVNSVRVSFRFAATHSEVDRALIKKYTRLFMHREGGTLDVLRKKAIPGWDVSFLFVATAGRDARDTAEPLPAGSVWAGDVAAIKGFLKGGRSVFEDSAGDWDHPDLMTQPTDTVFSPAKAASSSSSVFEPPSRQSTRSKVASLAALFDQSGGGSSSSSAMEVDGAAGGGAGSAAAVGSGQLQVQGEGVALLRELVNRSRRRVDYERHLTMRSQSKATLVKFVVDFVRQFESFVASGKLLLMQRVRFWCESFGTWGWAWAQEAIKRSTKHKEKEELLDDDMVFEDVRAV